ncbi:hypothetical protein CHINAEXTREME_04235 [Halobiforma lacisalsi AJ5]|uniref:Uncharacterized protein n=1 Tax=Natronobacterium lacisalsi AJ5 TaxID=358396 RepID=A0A1P8LMM6_NATLA|nr:hypothetical protein [Halobiforma lacisalsi]APW97028.1 hypothetical protein CHINAEXTREME_04235 [Halobiforma lacisalsi AJ5]
MDVRGLWALLCVFVVVGCSVAFVPFTAAAVDGVGEVGSQVDGDRESGASVAPAVAQAAQQEEPAEIDQLDDPDKVHIEVYIHENGSATFVVDYRFENGSESNWTALRDDVEEHPEMYAQQEASGWNETLEEARNATGRDQMEIGNVSVATDRTTAPQEIGHVEFTFEWHSFAYVELNRIDAGDALAGFTLSDDTTMRLFPPDGYVIGEVEPTPDDRPDNSVFWNGDDTEFADDEPYVEILENGGATGQEDEPDAGPDDPWPIVVAVLALLATVAAAGWWIRHQEILAPNVETGREANANGAGDADSGAGGSGTDAGAGRNEPAEGPPPELLSNEERVLRLLEQRGGRIKQQDVVSELDWTEAKTSQVVGGLREDGDIEVFRIGRENVLALPDEGGESGDVDDTGSGREDA